MASAGILVSEEVVHGAIETVIADNDSVGINFAHCKLY